MLFIEKVFLPLYLFITIVNSEYVFYNIFIYIHMYTYITIITNLFSMINLALILVLYILSKNKSLISLRFKLIANMQNKLKFHNHIYCNNKK